MRQNGASRCDLMTSSAATLHPPPRRNRDHQHRLRRRHQHGQRRPGSSRSNSHDRRVRGLHGDDEGADLPGRPPSPRREPRLRRWCHRRHPLPTRRWSATTSWNQDLRSRCDEWRRGRRSARCWILLPGTRRRRRTAWPDRDEVRSTRSLPNHPHDPSDDDGLASDAPEPASRELESWPVRVRDRTNRLSVPPGCRTRLRRAQRPTGRAQRSARLRWSCRWFQPTPTVCSFVLRSVTSASGASGFALRAWALRTARTALAGTGRPRGSRRLAVG